MTSLTPFFHFRENPPFLFQRKDIVNPRPTLLEVSTASFQQICYLYFSRAVCLFADWLFCSMERERRLAEWLFRLVGQERPDTAQERLYKSLKTYDVTLRAIVEGSDSHEQLWLYYDTEQKLYLASSFLQKILRGLLELIRTLEQNLEEYVPDILDMDNIGYRFGNYQSPIVISYGHGAPGKKAQGLSYYKELKNIVSYIASKILAAYISTERPYPPELENFLENLEDCNNAEMKLRVRRHVFLYTTRERIDLIRSIQIKEGATKNHYTNVLKPDPINDFRHLNEFRDPQSAVYEVFTYHKACYRDSSWLTVIMFMRHFYEHGRNKYRRWNKNNKGWFPLLNSLGVHTKLHNMYPANMYLIFDMLYADPVGRLVLH